MGVLRQIKRNRNSNTAQLNQSAQKAIQDAYRRGLEKGYYEGAKITTDIFFEALGMLQAVHGIGPKRYQAILEYFDHMQADDIAKGKRHAAT